MSHLLNDEVDNIREKILNFNSNTAVSEVSSKLEELGYTVFATPTHDKIDNNLVGTDSLIEAGKFNHTLFNRYLENFDQHPIMGMAVYDNTKFYGVALIEFLEFNNIKLKELFYPDNLKLISTYTVNFNNYKTANTFGKTKISLGINTNQAGFHSVAQFSQNNVIWGFANGHELTGLDATKKETHPLTTLDESDVDNPIRVEGIRDVSYMHKIKNYFYGMCNEDDRFIYWGEKHMLEEDGDAIIYMFTKFQEN